MSGLSYIKKGKGIGCKYLTDADLGRSSGSSQTHFGLLEGVFDEGYDSSVVKEVPVFVCGTVGKGTMCLNFISNPDGSLRSPKVRIGKTEEEKQSNIVRDIRSLAELFHESKWFLFFSENRAGSPFFVFLVQDSPAWNKAISLGIRFDNLDRRVITDDSPVFSTLSDYISSLFAGSLEQDLFPSKTEEKSDLTPEWFEEKAKEFPTLDQEAEDYLNRFQERFSVEKLSGFIGKDVLNEVFLNKDNKSNLCYVLEFDNNCRTIFGSIKSGTAYKYGLHYSWKNSSWATGSGAKPVFLSEDKAIELGTQIRDYLVAGAELISEQGELDSEDEYLKLYNDLVDVTDGYVNRVWFLKYYAMMFPKLFPVFYSHSAQMNVIRKLQLGAKDNPVSRMGEIAGFVRKCNISNVVFGRVFGTYCNNDDSVVEELDMGEEKMNNCLEIVRPARSNKSFPLNAIIYGAPGTGKTYSTAEYAMAIIEQRDVDLSFKTLEDRKKVMDSYNAYVKSGQVVFTTFHQNYGYEEFVQGLRPDVQSEEMSFKVVDGVFKRIADKALNETDPSKNYVIIIDEINRANISKVLGELITLIEEDKRWGEVNQTCATLQSGDVFAVPNNLYIVGTMNSADKSISLIDAALRRRFEFIEQKPIPELVGDSDLQRVFRKLNDTLAAELQSSDLLIGHSYFMGKTMADLPKIMNNSIVPLLYEYFYDNKKKVMSVLTDVLKDTGYEPVDVVIGRVSVNIKAQ